MVGSFKSYWWSRISGLCPPAGGVYQDHGRRASWLQRESCETGVEKLSYRFSLRVPIFFQYNVPQNPCSNCLLVKVVLFCSLRLRGDFAKVYSDDL